MSFRAPSWRAVLGLLAVAFREKGDVFESKAAAYEADHFIRLREAKGTRYSATETVSQQKSRRIARRVKPHGWKGGAR